MALTYNEVHHDRGTNSLPRILIKRSPYSSNFLFVTVLRSYTTTNTRCDCKRFNPILSTTTTTTPANVTFQHQGFQQSNSAKSPFSSVNVFNASFSYVTEKRRLPLDFWVDGEFIVVHHCEYCIQVHEFTVVRKFEGQYLS